MPSPIPVLRGPIWPVVERHFTELELLVELRTDALEAPDYDLDELSEELDRRLRAHLEGLGFAGEEAIERVVEPALNVPTFGRALGAAVASTILAVGSASACERVVALLDPAAAFSERAPDELWELREGVILGVTLSEREGIDDWLATQLGRAIAEGESPRLAGLLRAIAGRRRAPVELARLLAASDPELLTAAAMAARFTRDDASATALAQLVAHEHPRVCAAAIETSLIRRLPGAWPHALGWALAAPSCSFRRQALTWVALLGSPAVHARLLERLATSSDRAELADLLWAASFCGRPEAIPLALPRLGDPALGPLAAELICALAGLPVEDERLWLPRSAAQQELPPLELDDLEADISLRPEELLPRPNPDAFVDWWAREGPRLSATPRLLHGQPWSAAGLLERLRYGALRRRHPWALELAVRSGGVLDLDTRTWAHRQLQQLDSLDSRVLEAPIDPEGFGAIHS
ncbi:MAG: hypothetical protein R6X02_05435 [Enhygromyxa sp.]